MGTALGPGPHRIAAVGHGTVFFLLTVAGLGVLLLILALTLPGPGLVAYGLGQHHHAGGIALAPALPALGVSVFLICSLLLVMRRLASLTRRLVGQWCGVPIADPYLPQPWADGGKAGLRRRLGWLLTDRATWRDLLWVTVKQLYARELLASGSGGHRVPVQGPGVRQRPVRGRRPPGRRRRHRDGPGGDRALARA